MPEAPNSPYIRSDVLPPGSLSSARLLLARASLTACVLGVMVRDTRTMQLDEAQRFNYFPASPYCMLAWFFSGTSHMVEPGPGGLAAGPRCPMPSPLVFAGPHNRPAVSWNPGPVHALMLVIKPDALAMLTGIDPGAHINGVVSADEVLPAHWLALCAEVFALADDTQRVACLEDRLDTWWQAARPHAPMGSHFLTDWAHSLALRAANSGLGRSARQAERRIKQWTGQPLRELRGMTRSEQAFFRTVEALDQGELNWTDLAEAAGYTDQSHLCRQTRRITGFAPEALRRRIAEDEAFWAYRAMGFTEAGRPSRLQGASGATGATG